MTDPIRITTPAALLGAIPALLGFVPERSVVAVLFDGNRIQLLIRSDSNDVQAAVRVAREARTHHSTAVMLVAVAESRYASEALTQLDTVRAALDEDGVHVPAALYAHRLDAGASWTDLDHFTTGTVPDPAASPVAIAHAVVLGRHVAANRAELEARYRASEPAADTTAAVADYTAAPTDFARDTMTAMIAATSTNTAASDALAARVAVLVLSTKAHRDALLALGAVDADNAHHVMAGIARRARHSARVEILTLAGTFAYAASNGPEAAIAFDSALTLAHRMQMPAPVLLSLVESALDRAVAPERISELFTVGIEMMAALGIELPEQT